MFSKIAFSSLFTLILAATSGFAQSDVNVRVPFDFYAGRTVLPAGSYELDIEPVGLVRINRSDSRAQCMIAGIPIGGGPNQGKIGKLVFHRYGNEYFLVEVWAQGQQIGRKFRRTPHEDDMALNATRKQVELLASRR